VRQFNQSEFELACKVWKSYGTRHRHATESITSPNDALLNWRKSGEEIFKRFVQNQMELCHFFGHRCEQYLKLPEQLSQCRSLTELEELQSAFLSKFANDYLLEAGKLARPVEAARPAKPLDPPHR